MLCLTTLQLKHNALHLSFKPQVVTSNGTVQTITVIKNQHRIKKLYITSQCATTRAQNYIRGSGHHLTITVTLLSLHRF